MIRRTDGRLRLGATVRQAALERSRLVARALAAARAGRRARRPPRHPHARHASAAPWPTPTRAPQLPLALLALDAEHVEKGPLLLEFVLAAAAARARAPRSPSTRAPAATSRPPPPRSPSAPGHAAVAVLGVGRVARAEHALREGAGAREVAELAAETVDGATGAR